MQTMYRANVENVLIWDYDETRSELNSLKTVLFSLHLFLLINRLL